MANQFQKRGFVSRPGIYLFIFLVGQILPHLVFSSNFQVIKKLDAGYSVIKYGQYQYIEDKCGGWFDQPPGYYTTWDDEGYLPVYTFNNGLTAVVLEVNEKLSNLASWVYYLNIHPVFLSGEKLQGNKIASSLLYALTPSHNIYWHEPLERMMRKHDPRKTYIFCTDGTYQSKPKQITFFPGKNCDLPFIAIKISSPPYPQLGNPALCHKKRLGLQYSTDTAINNQIIEKEKSLFPDVQKRNQFGIKMGGQHLDEKTYYTYTDNWAWLNLKEKENQLRRPSRTVFSIQNGNIELLWHHHLPIFSVNCPDD